MLKKQDKISGGSSIDIILINISIDNILLFYIQFKFHFYCLLANKFINVIYIITIMRIIHII